jgi:hypothetical protein
MENPARRAGFFCSEFHMQIVAAIANDRADRFRGLEKGLVRRAFGASSDAGRRQDWRACAIAALATSSGRASAAP